MTDRATITFTHPGVQPPVYLVSPLSDPPWETLEMDIGEERTATGDLVFTRCFNGVPLGSYQYKIRIGPDHWVLDETRETAVDDVGNRNNVIHVKPEIKPASIPSATAVSAPPVPSLVVEKTDNTPSFGEDFGPDATSAQKLAHELRAADAVPDKVLVSPEPEPGDLADYMTEDGVSELDAAPLLRHESFEPTGNAVPAKSTPQMDIIEEGSEASSNEQTNPEASNEKLDGEAEDEHDDEFERAPLMSHETGLSEDSEAFSELGNAPLMPHETGLREASTPSSELENELLMPHETGSSAYGASEYTRSGGMAVSDSDYEDEVSELERAPSFSHEAYQEDQHGSGMPLFPHERHSRASSVSSGNAVKDGEPTFAFEDATPRPMFGEMPSSYFFIKRTGTNSELPHTLPQSDELDPNLSDPSLESFPISRDLILERVATIGRHLPEDETTMDQYDMHSPQFSVLSQACSSVDLGALTPHMLLKPVAEEDSSETVNSDVPSPIKLATTPAEAADRHDSLATSETPPAGHKSAESENCPTDRGSEAESVDKTDGANDKAKDWGKVYDAIATPAKVLVPLTPPRTPEKSEEATDSRDESASKENTPNPPDNDKRKTSKENVFQALSRVMFGRKQVG
ncbi:hypothetical protein BDV95DRAFT_657297 [Massariosphaeria phaeospora]|uniref:AMP-activated protein kinase glycogen-binding domain-containing protein n=1 Tax=Massariosphaeria phaeospora TaxID=100035 RepID=A0A7C8MGZ8_9PLEO|nr:hypothetical protein BDV95DRAFT_657297 [Massariosphaeria phaeospora]